MSKLDDFFGDSKEKKEVKTEGIEIDIEISCPECNGDPERTIYDKSKKKVTTVCGDHESTFEMDLSFIYG